MFEDLKGWHLVPHVIQKSIGFNKAVHDSSLQNKYQKCYKTYKLKEQESNAAALNH